jgi:hypothetical protein
MVSGGCYFVPENPNMVAVMRYFVSGHPTIPVVVRG